VCDLPRKKIGTSRFYFELREVILWAGRENAEVQRTIESPDSLCGELAVTSHGTRTHDKLDTLFIMDLRTEPIVTQG
jgi:hypothetical protein